MLDRKLADVVLSGLAVFGGVLLGSKIKGLKNEIEMLKVKNKLYEIVVESQQKIINDYASKKES